MYVGAQGKRLQITSERSYVIHQIVLELWAVKKKMVTLSDINVWKRAQGRAERALDSETHTNADTHFFWQCFAVIM